MFGKKKKTVVQEPDVVEGANKAEKAVTKDVDFKDVVLQRYLSKLQFSSQQELESNALKQNVVVLALCLGALVFCIMGIMNIWTKNANVGVNIQRIDGTRIEIVNDPRSKILLRKAIQNSMTKEQIDNLDLE
jgi:hypothetical protein